MSERELNVYRAKLAEQAERYDGKARLFRLLTAERSAPYFLSSLRRGLEGAGKPLHMDLLGEIQNGGVLSSRATW